MTEQQRSRLDLFFVYIAYSLRYLYLFLLIPFYARMLAPEGYGVVLAAMSLMQMVWLFVNWGFSIDGMREISTTKLSDYARLFGEHLTSRAQLSVVALLIGGVAIYASAVLSAHLWVGLMAILLGIISAYNLGWYFNGSFRPRKAVILEVLGFALNLILILSFVREPDDAVYAISGLLISGLISLCVAHWWIRKEVLPLVLDWQAGTRLIIATSPIFIYSSSAILLGAASTYLLSMLSTAEQVGYFGSAERLVGAGMSFMIPLGAVFIPKVTLLFKDDISKAFLAVRKVLFILLAIGVLGLVTTHFFGEYIVNIIFGDAFKQSLPILQKLSLIFPLYACTLVFSSYVLIPLKKEKLLAKIMIAGALVNLVVAVPLAMRYDGLGMAYARLISELFTFICLFVACYKLGYMKKIFENKFLLEHTVE